MMLDRLHKAGIEIVSPSFMNTRAIPETKAFVPRAAEIVKPEETPPEKAPEEIVFDKAIEAESIEKIRERFKALGKDIEAIKEVIKRSEDESEKDKLKSDLEQAETRRRRLVEYLEKKETEKKQD
jgi:small conductance mechanosensitive channel